MNLHKLHLKYLKEKGWSVECCEPMGLTHKDGSIAVGQAADVLLKSLNLPKIKETWSHPDLQLTCSYVNEEPNYVEHVYDADGKTFKPYYDNVKVGDYFVENGRWYGRREADGFRVLATHELVPCDDSKWEMKESLLEKDYYDDLDLDDDIPF